MTKLREVLAGPTVPVNSLAMLSHIRHVLDENDTNCLDNIEGDDLLEVRAALWVLNSQVHGQLATIDMMEELEEVSLDDE